VDVFVRLHLASFPAGGPFLPSLYINIIVLWMPCMPQMYAHPCVSVFARLLLTQSYRPRFWPRERQALREPT
jgi:hypothetical protein